MARHPRSTYIAQPPLPVTTWHAEQVAAGAAPRARLVQSVPFLAVPAAAAAVVPAPGAAAAAAGAGGGGAAAAGSGAVARARRRRCSLCSSRGGRSRLGGGGGQ